MGFLRKFRAFFCQSAEFDSVRQIQFFVIFLENIMGMREIFKDDDKVLSALIGTYACVVKVSLRENRFKFLIAGSRAAKAFEEEGDNCTAGIKKMLNSLVSFPFRKDVEAFLDFSTLEARLSGKKFINLEYVRRDGSWSILSFIPYETDENGSLRTILFTAQDEFKDNERHQISQNSMKVQEDIAFALSTKYISIYHVNLDKDIFSIQQITAGLRTEVSNFVKQPQTFSGAIESYIKLFVSPDDQDFLRQTFERDNILKRFRNEPNFSVRYKVKPNPQHQTYFEIYFVDTSKNRNEHLMVISWRCVDDLMVKEIAYQKILKMTLDNTNKTYKEILNLQSSGIVAYYANSKKIIIINEAAYKILGTERIENLEEDFYKLIKQWKIEDPKKLFYILKNLKLDQKPFQFEFTLMNNKAQKTNIIAHAKKIILDGDREEVVLITLTDITEKIKLQEHLQFLSETDSLTQIPNRSYGEQQIREIIEKKEEGAFCLLDVDKFKFINDTFGHIAGDTVLKTVASTLKNSFRKKDIVFRLGGDEFGVFLRDIKNESEAKKVVGVFKSEMKKFDFYFTRSVSVTLSIGVTLCDYSNDDESFDTIYVRADSAMYKSKKDNSDVKFYHNELVGNL